MEEPRRDHYAIEFAAADDEASNNSSSKPCIFEVPRRFKEKKPKSYIPESFSIGPLHYGKEHLKATEEIKQRYLNKLLARNPDTTLEEFKRSILKLEGRARECYAFPTNHLGKAQFIDMLVLDGCFIIELLRNNHKYSNNTIDEDDPVFSVCWVLQDLHHDLILLENQVPWFVLECLFDMTSQKIPESMPLTKLALDFFCIIFSVNALPSIPDGVKINHILDLLRNALVPPFRTEQQSSDYYRPQIPTASLRRLEFWFMRRVSYWQCKDPNLGPYRQQIPTATSLEESGFRFKRLVSRYLLDIRFEPKDKVLEIPFFSIQETTCEAFRNLISYEQCYPNCEPNITSYAIFLNNLISTTKDINLLHEAGIIDNWLNPNDTLEFCNKIYNDTFVKHFYYLEIYQQVLNQYKHRWWPKFLAPYMRMVRDPVGHLSVSAAVCALYLTLLQTIFTVKQFYNDNK